MPKVAGEKKTVINHSPLTQQLVDALREKILSGELASGERLVEERLSEEYSVSRMPVREALRQLAASGLVIIEPRRGASVANFHRDLLLELVEVRATLEALNARLAAKRHDPAQIAELEKLLAEGTRNTYSGDAEVLTDLNQRFHFALGEVAANSVLQEIMHSLRDRTAVLFAPLALERAPQNWEEHAAILRAVIKGDPELAGLLAARHIYNAAGLEP
ncbi:MAG: GntR family transcriptional regulator [Proteobacteria bacterium]|nr:GntR family transcriptional regulator [Pseudomonadota bacterium]